MSDFNLSSKILRDGDGYPCIRPQHAKEFIRLLKEGIEEEYGELCYQEGGFNFQMLKTIIDKRAGEELI